MKDVVVLACIIIAINEVWTYSDEGDDEYYTVPHYHFEYGVHDPHTKDHKSHEEYRDHDGVRGSYTIDEPDGTRRIVEYFAGKHTGFQAIVRREGHAHYGHDDDDDDHDHNGGTGYSEISHWGFGR